MDVTRIRALRGPNLWSRHPAIEAVVMCSVPERSLTYICGVESRVCNLFPAVGALLVASQQQPKSIAHLLESLALTLQAQAGCPVTYSRTAATVEPGVYQVVVEYSEEEVGRLAFELAQALLEAAVGNHPFDVDAAIGRLGDAHEDVRLGPSTGAIVDAAAARGIPFRRLTRGSLVQFGWGSRQRRIQAAEVDVTSAVAESIAQDKDLTKKLLLAAGVPVPYGRPVNSVDEAWTVALEIGLPVVVKPQDGNQGKGVTVNITTREQLDMAYRVAAEIGEVMVERFLPGSDYRLLVVGDRMVAAARRDPPQVLGNGVNTVRQLVDMVNADPKRGTGTNGKTTTVRLISHLLSTSGLRVGMTNTDGVYVEGRQIDSGDCSGPKSARNVLMHPDVDAAVFETARGGVLREGLGFDRCQVAVVTNVGSGDHLGLNYVATVEDLALIKRVIVQNVSPMGFAVLNATDPHVVAMAANCPGEVIYFAADRQHPVMVAHRAQGHRTVCVEGEWLVAAQGAWRERIALRDVPLTRNGLIGFQIDNAMAAIAAAWGVGLSWDNVRRGLATFSSDTDNVPGRFNMMSFRGATVIADYGHNPDAMRALVAAVEALPARRRSVVISGAGDRRDEDIREQTQILGGCFDDVLLFQDACQRGRADGEVLRLLREGLAGASRTRRIDEIHGEFVAIDLALDRLEPGDLCLVLVDQVDEALAHLAQRVAAEAVAAA